MAKFRSKPVEIEAEQFLGADYPLAVKPNPGNAVHGAHWTVYGAQGWSRVNIGDWIIKEPKGEGYYPCAAEVFAAKYEPLP